MSPQTSSHYPCVERVLSFTVAGIVGVSVLAFLVVIVGTFVGVRNFDEGVWPFVLFLPLIGLPIGFVLIITLMVITGIRRKNDHRDTS